MNTPAHVMAGAFVAQTVMVCRDRYSQRWVAIACGAALWKCVTLEAGLILLMVAGAVLIARHRSQARPV